MSRTGMSELINQVRAMLAVGTADYTAGTMAFWDDDQLQNVLDEHRHDIIREPMLKIKKYVGSGSVEYYEYRSRHKWYEQTDGGTANFIVEDSLGADQGTASWSADYKRGVVTFGSDTGGTTYYLTARRYDIFAAAADVARRTAGYYAKSFDVTTDGHGLKRSQLQKQFLDMARQFETQAEPDRWEFISD